jgi:dimethylargininase
VPLESSIQPEPYLLLIALTRAVPASINRCELTYQQRLPIDIERARQQHAEYTRVLATCGCQVIELPEDPQLADSVFVEDTALVFDECAVISRPGAESRRAEIPSVRAALSRYRELHEIVDPGTLDGGDVLRFGRRIFVGVSTRTNHQAVAQLRRLLAPYGYEVAAVTVKGALHLKSAVSVVADELLVVNTDAVDPVIFGTPYLEVPAEAANMLRVGAAVLCPAVAAAAAARLEAEGLKVQLVDNSELAKAEAGLTCCSLIFNYS